MERKEKARSQSPNDGEKTSDHSTNARRARYQDSGRYSGSLQRSAWRNHYENATEFFVTVHLPFHFSPKPKEPYQFFSESIYLN